MILQIVKVNTWITSQKFFAIKISPECWTCEKDLRDSTNNEKNPDGLRRRIGVYRAEDARFRRII